MERLTPEEAVGKFRHTDGEDVGRTKINTKEAANNAMDMAYVERVIKAGQKEADESGKAVFYTNLPEYKDLTESQKASIDRALGLTKIAVPGGSRLGDISGLPDLMQKEAVNESASSGAAAKVLKATRSIKALEGNGIHSGHTDEMIKERNAEIDQALEDADRAEDAATRYNTNIDKEQVIANQAREIEDLRGKLAE